MAMTIDGRALLRDWLAMFANEFSLRLFSKGDSFDMKLLRKRFSKLTSKLPDGSVIYVLTINKLDELVPVYIGKSNTPLKRWEGHFNGLKAGRGHYSKWRQILLENGKAKFDTDLSLIPSSRISRPPIPDFPTTIGSVEYQLVELASENYPETSLNVEGKRR